MTGEENTFPYPHEVKGDPIKAPLIMKNKEWGTLTAAEKAVAILWVSLGIRDDSMTAIKDYEDPPATSKRAGEYNPELICDEAAPGARTYNVLISKDKRPDLPPRTIAIGCG